MATMEGKIKEMHVHGLNIKYLCLCRQRVVYKHGDEGGGAEVDPGSGSSKVSHAQSK